MKDSGLYTLKYSFIVGSVCALLLTVVGAVTEPRKRANARAEEVRNVLSVLGVEFEAKASAAELVTLFEETIEVQESDEHVAYRFAGSVDGSVKPSVAIPLAGPGLWGPVKGFLAVDPELTTIRGVTFHEQEETPGLGGEIGQKWFCDQFKGKTLRDEAGNAGIVIGGPGAKAPNGVDAITGATMTCTKVQAILNKAIKRVVEDRKANG